MLDTHGMYSTCTYVLHSIGFLSYQPASESHSAAAFRALRLTDKVPMSRMLKLVRLEAAICV